MNEYISKKRKSAEILKYIIFGVMALLMLSLVLSGTGIGLIDIDSLLILIAMSPTVLFVLAIIYFVAFHPVMSSVAWLKEKNYVNIADDIILGNPTLPKSKIYCGKNALLCNKPFAIIPYSEIAWVHLYVRKLYGVITVEKEVVVYTKDGKKFSLRADENEFQWLLENYIVKFSPNVVIGFGKKQKMRYRQLNPNYKIATSKVMSTIGIVLLCIAAFFLVLGIANYKTVKTFAVSTIVIICLIVAVVLFVSSQNYQKTHK